MTRETTEHSTDGKVDRRARRERIDRLFAELRESIRYTDALIEEWHPEGANALKGPPPRV
ncbi:MAG TPA: hypothetical protein VHZ54_05345 [Solirubrobacterales bacterium]|nr:hypothetical protein [Solirubrobacterales bacterium]